MLCLYLSKLIYIHGELFERSVPIQCVFVSASCIFMNGKALRLQVCSIFCAVTSNTEIDAGRGLCIILPGIFKSLVYLPEFYAVCHFLTLFYNTQFVRLNHHCRGGK